MILGQNILVFLLSCTEPTPFSEGGFIFQFSSVKREQYGFPSETAEGCRLNWGEMEMNQ